jgi:hypothetical protein
VTGDKLGGWGQVTHLEGWAMSATLHDDFLFDLLVELSEHAEAKGMHDVAERLEAAMDALLAWETESRGPCFRSARSDAEACDPPVVPKERRLTFAA